MGTAPEPAFLLDRKWPFRIAVGLWLAIGMATWFVAAEFDRPAQVILAGLWVVGLCLLLRQFLRSLFGPVLAYDVLRVGRKRTLPRLFLSRFRSPLVILLVVASGISALTGDAVSSTIIVSRPQSVNQW